MLPQFALWNQALEPKFRIRAVHLSSPKPQGRIESLLRSSGASDLLLALATHGDRRIEPNQSHTGEPFTLNGIVGIRGSNPLGFTILKLRKFASPKRSISIW
jgi:hypothetical protein